MIETLDEAITVTRALLIARKVMGEIATHATMDTEEMETLKSDIKVLDIILSRALREAYVNGELTQDNIDLA